MCGTFWIMVENKIATWEILNMDWKLDVTPNFARCYTVL